MKVVLVAIIIIFIFFFFFVSKSTYTAHKLSSVVVIGCARDVGKYLPNAKKKIDMICSLFQKSKVIIYENDSIDDTLEQLKKWENAEIIYEKNVEGPRTVRLSHGRNLLMKKAKDYNYDYIVVIDMDERISDLTADGFLSSFNDEKFPDWACIGANQNSVYYDIWALRTYDDWLPFDFHECRREDKGEEFCFHSRLKSIDKTENPIKVKSCFGGLAIYKRKYINNCEYIGLTSDNFEVCEHVSFNEGIKDGNIYINPSMINS